MNATETLSLEDQLSYFDANFEEAYAAVLNHLQFDREAIKARSRARLEAGFPIYGDEMWGWTPKKLLEEILEELADAPNYALAKMRRESALQFWKDRS
jgi:hypothetical protein